MGKNKSLTAEIRQTITQMEKAGRSRNFIARELQISKTAVNNAIKKYKEHGTFDDLRRKGRPKKTSLRDDLRIKRLCKVNPMASSGFIKRELGLEVAERTIRHRLQKDLNFKTKKPIAKPLITTVPQGASQAESHEEEVENSDEDATRNVEKDEASATFASTFTSIPTSNSTSTFTSTSMASIDGCSVLNERKRKGSALSPEEQGQNISSVTGDCLTSVKDSDPTAATPAEASTFSATPKQEKQVTPQKKRSRVSTSNISSGHSLLSAEELIASAKDSTKLTNVLGRLITTISARDRERSSQTPTEPQPQMTFIFRRILHYLRQLEVECRTLSDPQQRVILEHLVNAQLQANRFNSNNDITALRPLSQEPMPSSTNLSQVSNLTYPLLILPPHPIGLHQPTPDIGLHQPPTGTHFDSGTTTENETDPPLIVSDGTKGSSQKVNPSRQVDNLNPFGTCAVEHQANQNNLDPLETCAVEHQGNQSNLDPLETSDLEDQANQSNLDPLYTSAIEHQANKRRLDPLDNCDKGHQANQKNLDPLEISAAEHQDYQNKVDPLKTCAVKHQANQNNLDPLETCGVENQANQSNSTDAVEYSNQKRPKREIEIEDLDLCFLKTMLPDMKKMNDRQRNRFKRMILGAVDEILYDST